MWLKAGIGTPQGGIISPLLANVALHGLENHLKDYVSTMKSRSSGPANKRDKARALGVVRYADNFVLIHSDKDILKL